MFANVVGPNNSHGPAPGSHRPPISCHTDRSRTLSESEGTGEVEEPAFRSASLNPTHPIRKPSSFLVAALTLAFALTAHAQKLRARDLGVPFDGTPGSNNAITDVKGVEVGHTTLISGEGKLVVGKGPVRTGVTAVLPRGKTNTDAVFAAWFTLNGNGEMTGTTWVEDSGFLDGPVMITNTHSVGIVRDAVIAWKVKHGSPDMEGYFWSLPVVAETWDGWLNDINGFHVHPEDAWHALDSAHSGRVEEGNVGGGTGMICNEFKGGIGTSSRVLSAKAGGYTVGVLVQCNYGRRPELRIAGVPVGKEIPEKPAYGEDETAKATQRQSDEATSLGIGGKDQSASMREQPPSASAIPVWGQPPKPALSEVEGAVWRPGFTGPENLEAPDKAEAPQPNHDTGSIIVVVATDAPLIPTQLKRVARRVSLGLGRDGSYSGDGSGDIFIAFSTANPGAVGSPNEKLPANDPRNLHQLIMLPNDSLDPIFLATVQATEEAVVNAMVAAETMTGIDNHEVIALPHDRLREVLKKYNRLNQ
jgi:D-aminopeptidase